VAAFGFTQYGGETPTPETETLIDPSGHSHFSALPRNSITLAEDPHAASAVIDFKNAGTERTERARNLSGNRDFFSGITPGIAINVRNGGSLRASSEPQGAQSDQDRRKNFGTHLQHKSSYDVSGRRFYSLLLDAGADFGDGPRLPTIMAYLAI
jgi:hypothetical protein